MGKAVCKDSGVVAAVHLDAGVAVVGGHDAVLGEDEVERAAGLPPIELDCDGGVAVGVPLVNFVKSVQNVT